MPRRLPPKDYVEVQEAPELIQLRAMAVVHSPHRERFGTPRQACIKADPELRDNEEARIELLPHVPEVALKDLEGFGYVWLLSWFHLNQGFSPTVRPPRGGGERRGVLATRAPHRPNSLGLSAARLVRVEGRELVVERVDLLDGTMIVDIKPYVPYADAFPDARAGWLEELPPEAP